MKSDTRGMGLLLLVFLLLLLPFIYRNCMVRTILPADLPQLRKIHDKFFTKEFTFDDFCSAWIANFVITDDNDSIISAGAIRPLVEIVAITDYDKSPRLRRSALYEMLQISQYILRQTNFTQLHAFIQDSKWKRQLLRSGFKPCAGSPVYFNLMGE